MGYPEIIDSGAFGEAVHLKRMAEKALEYALWHERDRNESKEDIQHSI